MATYRAVFDYSRSADGMLSFRSGDTFVVKNRTNDDWWTVENEKGGQGLVPVSYLEQVEVIPTLYHESGRATGQLSPIPGQPDTPSQQA